MIDNNDCISIVGSAATMPEHSLLKANLARELSEAKIAARIYKTQCSVMV